MVASRDGEGPERDERFPRPARIRHGEEIRELFRSGQRDRAPSVDLFWRPGTSSLPRLGAVVPKHGRSIVNRNRVRRRLREIGRREILPALRNRGIAVDVLLRARPEAYDSSYESLRTELLRLTERLCSAASPSP